MHNLNSISVSQDGTYAMLGGGIYGKEVIDALWKVGKQTGKWSHETHRISVSL